MHKRAIQEFPSSKLQDLQKQPAELRKELQTYKTHVEQLGAERKSLDQAQRKFNDAIKHFEDAEKHRRQYRQLVHQPLPSLIDPPPVIYPSNALHYWSGSNGSVDIDDENQKGNKIVTLHNSHRRGYRHTKRSVAIPKVVLRYDRNGRLISTNIPCPNDCGFLIGVSHGTHCCQSCYSLRSNTSSSGRGGHWHELRPCQHSQIDSHGFVRGMILQTPRRGWPFNLVGHVGSTTHF